MWGGMTESERSGYSRSDLNNSLLSTAYIADLYGIPQSEVSVVAYGRNEYYKAEVTPASSKNVFKITITQLIHLNNGYMYEFQFIGTSSNPYYKDFECLLESVDYSE